MTETNKKLAVLNDINILVNTIYEDYLNGDAEFSMETI